jgi:hypothetical protein
MNFSKIYSNPKQDLVFAAELQEDDLNDHRLCFHWERERTRFHVDEDFRKKVEGNFKAREHRQKELSKANNPNPQSHPLPEESALDILFPYYLPNWPKKAYLSHTYEERVSWEEVKHGSSKAWDEDLGLPNEVSFTINCDPGWSWSKLKKLFSKQGRHLFEDACASQGEKPRSERPLAVYKAQLKALGVCRLRYCLNYSWHSIFRDFKSLGFGDDFYVYEESFLDASKALRDSLKLRIR